MFQKHTIRDFTKKLYLIESFEPARHSHSRAICHIKKAPTQPAFACSKLPL